MNKKELITRVLNNGKGIVFPLVILYILFFENQLLPRLLLLICSILIIGIFIEIVGEISKS